MTEKYVSGNCSKKTRTCEEPVNENEKTMSVRRTVRSINERQARALRLRTKPVRRIMISVLTAILIIASMSLTSCMKSNTPTVVVEKQMQQIKDEKVETELSSLVSSSSIAKTYSDDYDKLLEKIQDFDYEVTNEKIDGDSAAVTVKITTYDFGSAYKSMIEQIAKDASAGTITSDTDMTTYAYKLMFKKFNALEEKNYTKEVEVSCTKNSDGNWETNIVDDSAIEDAILGGIVTAANSN